MKVEKILQKAHEKDLDSMVTYLCKKNIEYGLHEWPTIFKSSTLFLDYIDDNEEVSKLQLTYIRGILSTVKFDNKEPMLIDRQDVLV